MDIYMKNILRNYTVLRSIESGVSTSSELYEILSVTCGLSDRNDAARKILKNLYNADLIQYEEVTFQSKKITPSSPLNRFVTKQKSYSLTKNGLDFFQSLHKALEDVKKNEG